MSHHVDYEDLYDRPLGGRLIVERNEGLMTLGATLVAAGLALLALAVVLFA